MKNLKKIILFFYKKYEVNGLSSKEIIEKMKPDTHPQKKESSLYGRLAWHLINNQETEDKNSTKPNILSK